MNMIKTTHEIYWDNGDGTPSWPCGWCAGYVDLDGDGEIVDSESGGLPGTDSGDEGERTAYTDEQLVAIAVKAHGPAWADATVRR
jgi:hypothetical protein